MKSLRAWLGPPGAEPSSPREKAAITLGALLYTFGCYYAVALLGDPARGVSLRTRLDDAVPFCAGFMWGYVIVYTSLFMPVFTVRCQRLFRRTALAYLVVVTASVLVWIALPVTAVGLRADATALDLTRFHTWGLRVNYTLDPPLNLFPSLHVGIAVVAALTCGTARGAYGALAGALATLVTASTWLVKQHYVVDGLAGAAVAVAAYWAIVRPYDPAGAAPEEVAYRWRGWLAWLALHASVLAGLYTAFLLGWEPWA